MRDAPHPPPSHIGPDGRAGMSAISSSFADCRIASATPLLGFWQGASPRALPRQLELTGPLIISDPSSTLLLRPPYIRAVSLAAKVRRADLHARVPHRLARDIHAFGRRRGGPRAMCERAPLPDSLAPLLPSAYHRAR